VLHAGAVPAFVRIATPLVMVGRESGWPASADLDTAVALERCIIAGAAGVSHATHAIRTTVEQEMHVVVPEERRACIPLGVPAAPDTPEPAAGPPRLLFVGRLELRKGIDTLLAIVPALLARYPDLVVDVVGQDMWWPGTTTPVSRHFAAAHPSQSRCRFHGVVDDERLATFYRDCTVFVAPSRYESFGLIYAEAMRWGKPVVGCRAGGIPEVVRDGETGLLVPPAEAPALQAAVVQLLDDPALRARLGAAARASVEGELSAVRMAERTVAFYRAVLERRTISAGTRAPRAPGTSPR
jgi:glycosyltransferase involved in cell wall biosynthesis